MLKHAARNTGLAEDHAAHSANRRSLTEL